ncbi:MAG TPA: heavy metal translocating P-type ATPase [Candidatus Saccharimonadales bacterium]|nr:heavy metal translocating P-type ATPase [Candidatus Saccharimonadales bacterium]
MKRLLRFLHEYKLFSLALVALVAALILQFSSQPTIAQWVLGSVALLETLPLLWDMWQDVRSGSYGIDILAATAIVVSVVLHQSWAAMVIVLMLTGGESLEDFAEHRARSELDALLERAPQKAHVLRKGKMVDVRVSELHVGDKIIIKPGEVVPVDALIIEGTAEFDESSLTGESLPQAKQSGEQILSGSINLDGAITAKATATAADSQYQQIIKLVRSAASSQAPFVRLADRYSVPFTITAFAIAGAVWAVSGQAIRFLEVIVVATPCPLLLAAPIALVSGMARASKYGVIVKTGSALERLAEAKTFAFDKTGTLTQGELRVADVTTFQKHTKQVVLGLAAGLEQSSNHVVAQAIVAAAQDKKVKLTKAKHVQELAGRGLKAMVKGQEVLVGRFSLLTEHNVTIPKQFKQASIKHTATYVAVDGELIGVITFEDELREDSQATLDYLRSLGVNNMVLVTGDNQATAQAVAHRLGIENFEAEALPGDKLRAIETVARPVVFIGDGVNDAPVLTAADVGIALGARGSTAASESADLVIMTDDISRVATALQLAQRTFQIARQSILYGIGLSLVLMAVFATGHFPPLAGAILQEVVDVVVIFNALRAHLIKA